MSTLLPPKHESESHKAVSDADLKGFRADFSSNDAYRQSLNAVCTTTVAKVALNRSEAAAVDNNFSVQLVENPATSQKSSGRCWMFAALNLFRTKAQELLKVEPGFEYSQNYAMFWDKLEKANYFLENILSTLDEPTDSRLIAWLLSGPVQDGGQWDMFASLLAKYGAVPKTVMPETESSSSTGQLNSQLTAALRADACELRKLAAGGAKEESLRARKQEMMSEVYRVLSIHLGEPPTTFSYQWRDKDKEFHRIESITPQEFFAQYSGVELSDMICLIHDPRPGHAFGKTYTVKFLGNVLGGRPTVYLNTDLDTIKSCAIAQLKGGAPVWFGCDVGKNLSRDLGVMNLDIFDYDLVYGKLPKMNKAERLMYGHSQMTHAMVFTGVDLGKNDKPAKWRVENSWGTEPGDKGFFQMTDAWFDEYTYEVVVNKNLLPAELQDALTTKPIELEPWDPMGSLA